VQPRSVGEFQVSFIAFARWTSALIVVLAHSRALSLVGMDKLTGFQRVLAAPYYLISAFSFEAVMVFFVLSGYLVGGRAVALAANGHFSVRDYAVDRVTRIYAVLIPALLLTASLDRLGQTFFPQSHYYDAGNAILQGRFDVPFGNGSSLPTFLCNLVQVQPIRCSIYGSDIPLWSLSYEVLYYACAGALALAIQRRGWTMALPFVFAGWLLFVLGVSGIFLSIPWVFGALIYLFQQRAEGKNKSRAIAFMLAGAALFLASRAVHVPVGQNVTLGHLLAGIAFGLALIGTGEISRLRTPQGKPEPAKRFYRFNLAMSDFSYSLYLIHFPVLVLYFSVVTAAGGLGGLGGPMGHRLTMSNVSIIAVGILLALFVAWSFGRLFERNTWKLRRLLGSKRPRKDSPVDLTLRAGS
jgi:peptidoglycan/LPS O-acetylase OafA/YrhL